MLKKDFGECGAITSLRMLYKDDGSSKGCCFITYENSEGVDKALKFDGEDYGGRWLKVNKAGDKPDGKGKGKDGKGKGKDGKGKGKDKGKPGDAVKAKAAGSIKEFEGTAKKFDDSDE